MSLKEALEILGFGPCYHMQTVIKLLAAFPTAKVIHSVRDPDRRYDSTYETIFQAGQTFPRWLQRLMRLHNHFWLEAFP